MPADRLIHPRQGHSEKVSKLKDFEFRVWLQYLLSADDFGVLFLSPFKLKAENHALSCRSDRSIMSALEKLERCGLLRSFDHQGRRFLYAHDWQDWQKVTWPGRTIHPAPPAAAIAACTPATQLLYSVHPGARKVPKKDESSAEDVPEFSRSTSEELSSSRVRVPAERLTANGIGLKAHGSGAPLHSQKEHRSHAACGRVCVPSFLHSEFVRRRGGDAGLDVFYTAVMLEWGPGGPRSAEEPGESVAFWRARYAETWPAADRKPVAARNGVYQPRERAPWVCPHIDECNGQSACRVAIALKRPEKPGAVYGLDEHGIPREAEAS